MGGKQDGKAKFKCDYCDFESQVQTATMDHILKNHEIEKCPEFKCEICGKDFVEASQLQTHQETEHTAE